MTRINCVPVELLSNQHLVAEYKELPRVFTLIRNRLKRKDLVSRIGTDIPCTYRMGEGHVKFFFNKVGYLRTRYVQLIEEMNKRGFSPNFDLYSSVIKDSYDLPECLQNDWIPTTEAMLVNSKRILERLQK